MNFCRIISALLVGFSLMFGSSNAFALSCAPVEFNDEAIDAADLIFEGKVLEVGPKPVPADQFDMDLMQKYVISIDKQWKGDIDPLQVVVWMNSYWGDMLSLNEEYLVVAVMKDGEYISPLCGATEHLQSADEQIRILNMKFGKTHNKQE